ncbi:hypothetical protein ACJ73_03127 [Blastomyces percursus]|uniref:Uncharacterized protein n=1 Tax=Blastomyces percursus TaxID=1658174 RepID=A0A1J9QAN1_9EURO|nr:hypothetical protein ACJ73_03127 [Blastomyces percursus]
MPRSRVWEILLKRSGNGLLELESELGTATSDSGLFFDIPRTSVRDHLNGPRFSQHGLAIRHVTYDITELFEHELALMREPRKERVKKLTLKADGLFIYAATACGFLAAAASGKLDDLRLDTILSDGVGKTLRNGISIVYTLKS